MHTRLALNLELRKGALKGRHAADQDLLHRVLMDQQRSRGISSAKSGNDLCCAITPPRPKERVAVGCEPYLLSTSLLELPLVHVFSLLTSLSQNLSLSPPLSHFHTSTHT